LASMMPIVRYAKGLVILSSRGLNQIEVNCLGQVSSACMGQGSSACTAAAPLPNWSTEENNLFLTHHQPAGRVPPNVQQP
jgi:hypothetical protein